MRHARPVLLATTVLVAMVTPAIWGLYSYLLWVYRMAGHPTDETIEANARFAAMLAAIAVLNIIAVVAFVLRPRRYGWWLLLGAQVANAFGIVMWLNLGYSNPSSVGVALIFVALGVTTTALLLVFRLWPRAGRVQAPR